MPRVSVPSTLVGWCEECHLYIEPYTPCEPCPGDHDQRPDGSWRPFDFTKRLRKRRMYICRVEWCERMGFFTLDGWREHFLEHVQDSLDAWEVD